MRPRLVILAAVLVVAAVQLSRESGRAVAPARERENPASATPAPLIAPAPPAVTTSRDPFRFADQEPVAAPERRAHSERVAPPTPEPAPARVRLIGLVRRAGVLRAALVVDGELALASPGDTVGGFRVLSLDEEGGVRVRDPLGVEATLALSEEP